MRSLASLAQVHFIRQGGYRLGYSQHAMEGENFEKECCIHTVLLTGSCDTVAGERLDCKEKQVRTQLLTIILWHL